MKQHSHQPVDLNSEPNKPAVTADVKRSAPAAMKPDLNQVQQEISGAPDEDRKTTLLESAPESERWDPLPGSPGHKMPVNTSADEDADGRSTDQQLVEAGIEAAEQDQMQKAGRRSEKIS